MSETPKKLHMKVTQRFAHKTVPCEDTETAGGATFTKKGPVMTETPQPPRLTAEQIALKNEHMARAWARLALCPDHRDKATGVCVVCQGERREQEAARERESERRAELEALRAERDAQHEVIRRVKVRADQAEADLKATNERNVARWQEQDHENRELRTERDRALSALHTAAIYIDNDGPLPEYQRVMDEVRAVLAASPAPSRATAGEKP